MNLTRRTALGALAAAMSGATAPRFFSESEYALLDAVAALIIPADERSGGAREALVARFIDFLVAHCPEAIRANWKTRLAAFDRLAVERCGKPFLQAGTSEQTALLDLVARNENDPRTPTEHFFADLKKATLFAYYTCQTGLLKELGYQGNRALHDFPGCAR